MKIFKKILLGFGFFLAGVLLLALLIWFFPQTVINTAVVKWVVGKQSSVAFTPQFPEDFDIQVRNSRIVRQKIKIHASNFCLKMTDGSLNACFDQFDFAVALNFKKFSLMFDSIGPMEIISSSIDYKSIPKKEPVKTRKSKNETSYPSFSKDLHFEPILVSAPKVVIDLGKSKMNASLNLQGKAANPDAQYILDLKTRIESNQDPQIITADLSFSAEKTTDLTGTLKAHVGSDGKMPSVDLDSKFQGNLIRETGEFTGNLRLIELAPMLPLVDVYQFKLTKDQKLKLDADFRTELMVGYLNEPKKSALPPPKFKTKFDGKVVAEQSGKQPVKFNLKINPSRQYGLQAQAKAKGQYNLKNATLDLETFFLDLAIEDFSETVRGLKNTQMAVPAPLNALDGSIRLSIGAETLNKPKKGTYEIPVNFKTDLSSPKQSLSTTAKGNALVTPTPFSGKLDLDVHLNDIAIQLPDFDPISGVPVVIGDSRFVSKKDKLKRKEIFKEEEEKPSDFKMNITVDTPQKPIRILYKLFKPAAMFRVKTKIQEGTSDFNVKFEPFDVSYLKRTARLERLKIENDEESKSVKLDGRFSIKKADYMIYVDIEQVGKESYVTLSSEPPLSEDDIVSLILFNELASNLDSTSNDSVQDTQAAMTKKTIGFLSFFALASTPIESVNYDPTTQQYSARVKLPGGFTGTVGSDWENSQQVGIRRRLGGKFVISAGVGTDSKGEQRQETMIEWYHRY